jgi:hypothetical protein
MSPGEIAQNILSSSNHHNRSGTLTKSILYKSEGLQFSSQKTT